MAKQDKPVETTQRRSRAERLRDELAEAERIENERTAKQAGAKKEALDKAIAQRDKLNERIAELEAFLDSVPDEVLESLGASVDSVVAGEDAAAAAAAE